MQLMQVVPSVLMAKIETNANAAMWFLNLVQVTELISGSVVPLAMFYRYGNTVNFA